MSFKRVSILCALLLLLGSTIFSILFNILPAHAQSVGPVVFVDKSTVTLDGKTYKDVNPYDNGSQTNNFSNHGNYKLNGNQDSCDQIDINNFASGTPSAKYTYCGTSGTSNTVTVSIDQSSLPKRFIDGYRIDADTLFLPVGIQDPGCGDLNGSDSAWFNGAPSEYFKRAAQTLANGQPNPDYQVNGYDEYSPSLGGGTSGDIETQGGGKATLNGFKTSGCTGNATPIHYGIQLANDGQIFPPPQDIYGKGASTPPGGDKSGGSGSSANQGDNAVKCDASLLDDPLKWLLCPLINGAVDAVQSIDNAITDELNINTDEMFGTSAVPGADSTESGALHAAWSSFRTVALGLLVLIAVIMVISQAIGAGPFDAYTIRRVLPRLLIAVIAISLSWTLMKLAVDISNDLGHAVRSMIYEPFSHLNGQIDGTALATILLAGGGALFVLGPVGVLTFAGAALVAVLTAFVVIILRHMLIIFLVVVAPVGIIMSILPGTQKAWKLWYDYFLRALLVFPIIAAFISVGRAFAVIAQVDPGGVLGSFIAVLAWFGPYFLLPTAFRLAGGAIGTVSGIAAGRAAGAQKTLADKRKEKGAQQRERIGRRVVGARADFQNRIQTAASKDKYGRAGRFALRRAAWAAGGYNIQAAAAARQASVGKEINDQIATGRDEEIRGLTVDKKNSTLANGRMRIDDKGNRQYKSLGGAWVNEAAVDEGHRRWGGDRYAQQAALSYEMRKASSEEDLQNIGKNYSGVTKSWGMSENQAGGAWIGAAFENQNQHLEYKNMNWKTGGHTDDAGNYDKGRSSKFVDEIYEKRGSYPMAQMSSNTIEELKQAHVQATARGDTDQQQKIAGIAETFMHELGGGAQFDAEGAPVAVDPEGRVRRQAGTPGAAHVAERVRELADMTGVLGSGPSGFYGPGHTGNLGPAGDRREQK